LTLFVKKISQCFLSGNPSAKWPWSTTGRGIFQWNASKRLF
jgi:hypothetical protein